MARPSEQIQAPQGEGLRQADILNRLEPATRQAFERHCTQRRVPAGAVLFAQGESHSDTFLITDGLVRTYYLSPVGKEITMAFWSAGNVVGGPDFFGTAPHVWSARAVKNTTVLAIEGATLKTLTKRFPDLADCIMDAITFKMHWISELLQTFATECVTDRLAHQLVRLGVMHGHAQSDGIAIGHEFTQEDLATMVGATRQWVSTTLNQLQRAGLIRLKNRHLVIRDLEALRSFGTVPGGEKR